MSSLRNAVQRRNHKERSQPQNREKWGLLEKHKDYSLRAADYNLKKRKLSILSQKARERHPDEFAFGMLSAEKSRQGKHGRNGTQNRLGHDTVKLLKTQDLGYLRTVGQKGRRQIEEVEREVTMGKVIGGGGGGGGKQQQEDDVDDDDEGMEDFNYGAKRKGTGNGVAVKKIKFVDSEDEDGKETESRTQHPTGEKPEAEESSSDDNNDVTSPSTNPKIPPNTTTTSSSSKHQTTTATLRAIRKKRNRLRALQAAKLQALKLRQKEIVAATNALEEQRARMSRTIGGVNKNGVAFLRKERKR